MPTSAISAGVSMLYEEVQGKSLYPETTTEIIKDLSLGVSQLRQILDTGGGVVRCPTLTRDAVLDFERSVDVGINVNASIEFAVVPWVENQLRIYALLAVRSSTKFESYFLSGMRAVSLKSDMVKISQVLANVISNSIKVGVGGRPP